jgi:predicted dehydrogenase
MVRVAIAGTGGIAAVHAAAFAGLPGVRLAAAVNHRPESLERFARRFGVPRTYPRLDDLLHDGVADLVVVCTPNALHAPQAIAALDAGLHVLVEKPLALSAGEGRAMVKAAERAGRVLAVAHCWRHDAEARWVRERVARGEIGDVVRTVGFGSHVEWGPSGWFARHALAGGGALVDMGVHALDTARYLLGDPAPRRVFARIERRYGARAADPDADVDDTGLVVVEWEGGARSQVECGWWQPHADGPEAATRLYGTSGYASLFPTLVRRRAADGRLEEEAGGFAPRRPHCLFDMYEAQAAAFAAAVRGEASPVAAGRDALAVQRVLDAAYESSRAGQVVALEEGQGP